MLVTPNLTKHSTGMLGRYNSEEGFVARMKAGGSVPLGTRDGKPVPGSPMPWGAIAQMSDDDLRALYRYLNSLDPVDKDTGPSVQDAE